MSYPGTGKMYRDNEKAGKRRPARAPAKVDTNDQGITDKTACVTCGESFAMADMYLTEDGNVCPAHFTG